jgi:DNA-binding NarL/FixJ family response regulator
MIKTGISSYLLKTSSIGNIVQSIHLTAKGETYFPTEVSMILFQHFSKSEKEIDHQFQESTKAKIDLTPREVEILKYISDEFTNKEIAEKLFISQRTVDTHRRNLLSKIGVKNTVGLVKYYLRVVCGFNQILC